MELLPSRSMTLKTRRSSSMYLLLFFVICLTLCSRSALVACIADSTKKPFTMFSMAIMQKAADEKYTAAYITWMSPIQRKGSPHVTPPVTDKNNVSKDAGTEPKCNSRSWHAHFDGSSPYVMKWFVAACVKMQEMTKRREHSTKIDHIMARPALRIAWRRTRSSSKISEVLTTRMTRIKRATRTSRAMRNAPTMDFDAASSHKKTNSRRPNNTKVMSK
mmetsp:Transcript_25878/g.74729  ORF Transcript_25878/g.74729 Transcript_25878/m.74729 type:complete len:218 (+) Transcript_25878:407-1060(+)